MVDFVGAGCGAKDLITLRGLKLIQQANVIIYAGSLVNPELLEYAKPDCETHNSALMTLDEVIDVISAAESSGKRTVRLHTGTWNRIRGVPRGKQLLRSRSSTPGGIHPALGQPDSDHHAHGRAHPGAGA